MVGLVLAAVAGVYLLRARTPASPGQAPVESGVSIPQPVPASQNDNAAAAEAARRSETAAAYAGLEASRKTLQKELSDLKSALWGRELPADQARNISRDMMSAQYLLRNPPLLGAFSDAAGVQAEKDRVDAAQVRLQEISRTLGEGKSQ
jgi:predicted component of type VI protein secretion system